MVVAKIDKKRIPKHIGIIMDGNRRWAARRGLTAMEGHKAGVKALIKIVEHCLDLGVETLTIYALSTENWRKRAKKEVEGLFNLLVRAVDEKKEEYRKKGVKLAVIGDFQAFPRKVVRAIEEMAAIVKTHERLKVNVALNYGGRDEILRAVKRIIEQDIPANKINEEMFGKFLYTNGEPDPDFLIRTGGEERLSNFLLWQLSYSELYFTNTLWPDFSPRRLDQAIIQYQKRQRRFGGGEFKAYNRFAKTPLSQSRDVGKGRFQASPVRFGKALESLKNRKNPDYQSGEAYKSRKSLASRKPPGGPGRASRKEK